MMTCVSERSGIASSGMIAQGEDAAEGQRRSRKQNESVIPERKLNDCLEHGWRQESKTEWVKETE